MKVEDLRKIEEGGDTGFTWAIIAKCHFPAFVALAEAVKTYRDTPFTPRTLDQHQRAQGEMFVALRVLEEVK